MTPRPSLVLVPTPPRGVRASRPDALVVLLFAIHAVPVLALAAGRSWGVGLQGYATFVALVTGRELVRELRDALRRGRA